jgi:4-amino-4-deoxy-L-arabinose transferase-like glycosyltransferase
MPPEPRLQMPVESEHARFRGVSMPLGGWTVALLLGVYVLAGLTGHDPWKHDDAVTIGVVHDLIATGNWLTLSLAGRPYPDAPLYYWVAAASGHLFSWLLPLHEAARLASGLFTLLALGFILLAARELHGREQAPAAPLLLAGSIGFLFHAHEAQPMLATLTAHTAAYWGLTQIGRRPLRSALCFGSALGAGFLANGLAGMLPLLPVAAFVVWRSDNRQRSAMLLLASLVLACVVVGCWLAALSVVAPAYLASFWQHELIQLGGSAQPLPGFRRLLLMLPWYAWPAFPLVGWTLWAKRRQLTSTALVLPIFALLTTLLLVSLWLGSGSAPALLLLPPLVLLAVPGVFSLRRGAANAFDWFGMITFSIFAVLAWIGWCAMTFGWPEKLARQAVRLAPGFTGQLDLAAAGTGLLGTLLWGWLIASSPRSPMRGIVHWMAGLSLFWLLVTTLWMPWIDYGKTYRGVSASLAAALPEKRNCIANANASEALLASLDYFDSIRTVDAGSATGKRCELLLIHGLVKAGGALPATGDWRRIWEGGRPVDRRDSEKLYLYRRQAKRAGAAGR